MSEAQDWVEVATVDEFEKKDRKLVDLGDRRQIGIFKLDDGFHAVSAWCSHQRMSLMDGDILDDQIMCPLHGALFDIRTGKNMTLPAVRPIASYETRVEGSKIFVKA